MKMRFVTLGCKVNQYETEALRELLEKEGGFTVAEEGEAPDIFLLNSCTVTAESDRKTRQTLRHYKRKYPDCITVLFGCMAQNQPDAAAKLSADIVFGNTDHKKLYHSIMEYINGGASGITVEPHITKETYQTPSVSSFSERTRAYMKIEDGCNRFCSYCAIPYARGRVRSRDTESIKNEAKQLSDNGYKEVVLVGINLSAFGQDTDSDICDAVEAVGKIEGIERIRLGSLEPDHISDEMLNRLYKVKQFCPQFHLSLQSGCDETLKRMNRHYDTEFYADLVRRIKMRFEDASVTTDIMVGFAGETDEEFQKSLEFVKSQGFAKCHVFTYSKREGTAAVKLGGHIPNSVKQRRAALMLNAAEEAQKSFLRGMVNKTEKVLFETEKDGYIEGYTENYTRVRVKTDIPLSNEICEVYLERVCGDYIEGKIAEK